MLIFLLVDDSEKVKQEGVEKKSSRAVVWQEGVAPMIIDFFRFFRWERPTLTLLTKLPSYLGRHFSCAGCVFLANVSTFRPNGETILHPHYLVSQQRAPSDTSRDLLKKGRVTSHQLISR